MKPQLLALIALGGILIAGTLAAIQRATHPSDGGMKAVFASDAQAPTTAAPASAEPLFPGQPGR